MNRGQNFDLGLCLNAEPVWRSGGASDSGSRSGKNEYLGACTMGGDSNPGSTLSSGSFAGKKSKKSGDKSSQLHAS